jgi:hypothetical protein
MCFVQFPEQTAIYQTALTVRCASVFCERGNFQIYDSQLTLQNRLMRYDGLSQPDLSVT